jgi:hypothetical protein
MEIHIVTQPNFQLMDQKELRKYVLEHREDQDAFHAYVDKLYLEGQWIEMPPMQSEQDLEDYPEFLDHLRRSSQPSDNTL